MKHALFWAFQISVMAAVVVVYGSLLQIDGMPPGIVQPGTKQTAVLASSSVDFNHADDDTPDPNEILAHVNQKRIRAGHSPLIADNTLEQVAQERADEMVRDEYYAHKHPSTQRTFVHHMREKELGYDYACENLNLTFHIAATRMVQDWSESLGGHNECMLHQGSSHAGYAVRALDMGHGESMYIIVALQVESR